MKPKIIRSLRDLAEYLRVDTERRETHEDLERGIQRRVYKDTECGCSCSISPPGTRVLCESRKTFMVEVHNSITGLLVACFRQPHGKTVEARCCDDVPQALREYLEMANGSGLHVIGSAPNAMEPPCTCEACQGTTADPSPPCPGGPGYTWTWLQSSAVTEPKKFVTRHGQPCCVLTLHTQWPVQRKHSGAFSVSGYCEGVDTECPEHEVYLPCEAREIDEAIGQADTDADDLWMATHGCKDCKTKEGSWGYKPVDPNCPSCGGDGIII